MKIYNNEIMQIKKEGKTDEQSWQYLSMLTKEEIIEYLEENNWFHFVDIPTEYEIAFFKWEKESARIQKAIDKHLEKGDEISALAKKHDELVQIFNETRDESLLDDIVSLRDRVAKYHQKAQKLNAEYDRAYKSLETK